LTSDTSVATILRQRAHLGVANYEFRSGLRVVDVPLVGDPSWIIEQAMFRRVEHKLARRRKTPSKGRGRPTKQDRYLLGQQLAPSVCGEVLAVRRSESHRDYGRGHYVSEWYACANRECGCTPNLPRAATDDALAKLLWARLANRAESDTVTMNAADRELSCLRTRMTAAGNRVTIWTKRVQKAQEDYWDADLAAHRETALSLLEEAQNSSEDANTAHGELAANVKRLEALPDRREQYPELGDRVLDQLRDGATTKALRSALQQVVDYF